MSERVLAVLLSFGLLGGMFLWVPLLDVVCPPCGRFLRRRRFAAAHAVDDAQSTTVPTTEAA